MLHVGAGARDVDRICQDEERLWALVTLVPEASKSRRRMRFSRLGVGPGGATVDEDGDLEVVLLELVDGLWAARREGLGEEVGDGRGLRASRQVVVRGEGSSSEKM